MKSATKLSAFLLILSATAYYSCSHVPGKGLNNLNVRSSKNGERESHNFGENCLRCHDGNDDEAPKWTVGGSVKDSKTGNKATNCKVLLYTGPGETGVVAATIEVDDKGNFYTNQKLDYSKGLYPVVVGASGNKSFMSVSIGMGACNSCHNQSEPFITVDN